MGSMPLAWVFEGGFTKSLGVSWWPGCLRSRRDVGRVGGSSGCRRRGRGLQRAAMGPALEWCFRGRRSPVGFKQGVTASGLCVSGVSEACVWAS